jgi:VWFA-related protein
MGRKLVCPDKHLNNMKLRCLAFASVFAILCVSLPAQIIPGQLPNNPPPQPGQLGNDTTKPKPAQPDATNQGSTFKKSPTEEVDEGTKFKLGVRYVLVPTSVLDPDGHGYVNGLQAGDFEILDNDKPQKVQAETVEQPMSVVLVVQANADVEPLLPKIKKSGILLHGLVTGQEGDLAILAFDHRMLPLLDFTSDPDKIDDAMQKIRVGSSSARMVDAVVEADHMLKRHDPENKRRRVIILMSRNSDKGSEARMAETVRDMQFDNIVVYSVNISKVLTALLKPDPYPRPANGGIPPEGMPPITGGSGPRTATTDIQQGQGENALNAVPPLYHSIRDLFKKTPAETFTEFTGGRIYSFATTRGLEDAITDIGKDLNSQYLLSYSPSNNDEPGFHTIRVLVNRPGLKIRTRSGYWWGGGKIQ